MKTPAGFDVSKPYTGPDGKLYVTVSVRRWRVVMLVLGAMVGLACRALLVGAQSVWRVLVLGEVD